MSDSSTARSYAQDFTWWQGDPGLARELADLRDIKTLRDAADQLLIDRVGNARAAEQPWSAIGDALGITKEGARKRFNTSSHLF